MLLNELSNRLLMAQRAVEAGEFDEAFGLSSEISCLTNTLAESLNSRGTKKSYLECSVIVVGHKRKLQHPALLKTLVSLDPNRFEVILIGNSLIDPFPAEPTDVLLKPRRVVLGANLGVGVARNVGLSLSQGRYVFFLDDDGETTSADIEELACFAKDQAAIAARGRVVPFTDSPPPPHYHPANWPGPRYCDIEGFSVWDREIISDIGGFDPILFGHEGMELTFRLVPHHGVQSFLYTPMACLQHNFSDTQENEHQKVARYETFGAYVRHHHPSARAIMEAFEGGIATPVSQSSIAVRHRLMTSIRERSMKPRLQFVTLAEADPDPAHLDALSRQSDFRFVRTIIPANTPNLATRLREVVKKSSAEVVLICSDLEIPLPHRVALTKAHFADSESSAALLFQREDWSIDPRAAPIDLWGNLPLSDIVQLKLASPITSLALRRDTLLTALPSVMGTAFELLAHLAAALSDGHALLIKAGRLSRLPNGFTGPDLWENALALQARRKASSDDDTYLASLDGAILAHQHEMTRQRANRLLTEIEDRDRKIIALYQSTSWRITRPLRFLRRIGTTN